MLSFFVCRFGFNAQHLFLSIKIIKQVVVITSCCNIMLFYHGAVFDERPPWHPGVLWWFFLKYPSGGTRQYK